MKKLLLLCIPAAVLLTSCGGDESGDSEEKENGSEETTTDYSDMETLDLSEHQLPAKIKIPQITGEEGAVMPIEVIHEEDDFIWEIRIGEEGEKFRLVIEDMAAMEGDVIADHKRIIEGTIYDVEYIIDESDLIMYKQMIEGEASVDPRFGVCGVVEIDGYPFKLYSSDQTDFRKPQVEDMMRSIRSIMESAHS